jgi:hypothetical protein
MRAVLRDLRAVCLTAAKIARLRIRAALNRKS